MVMKNKPKITLRFLLGLTLLSLTSLIVLVGLHEHLYSFDPYSWANSKVESVESRNLWNQRKDLYRWLMLIFFCPTIGFGLAAVLVWLRQRSDWRDGKEV